MPQTRPPNALAALLKAESMALSRLAFGAITWSVLRHDIEVTSHDEDGTGRLCALATCKVSNR